MRAAWSVSRAARNDINPRSAAMKMN